MALEKAGVERRRRARRHQRVERALEHVDESLSRARADARLPAHLPPRAAGQGRRHRRRRRARAEGAGADHAADRGAVPHGARRARRGGRPRRGRADRRAVGRRRRSRIDGRPHSHPDSHPSQHTPARAAPRADAPAAHPFERSARLPALADGTAASRSPTSTGPAARRCRARSSRRWPTTCYHHNANTHWALPDQRRDRRGRSPARARPLADFLNAAPDEVAFGANMTTLTFHLARALGRALGRRATRSSSPSSITTPTSTPWRALARERGRDGRGRSASIPETGSSTGTTSRGS